MSDYDMSIHQNPDAQAWAKFFCAQNPGVLDEGIMIGWFANAMMAMHDHLTGQSPVVLPDGSAFFVGLLAMTDTEHLTAEDRALCEKLGCFSNDAPNAEQ